MFYAVAVIEEILKSSGSLAPSFGLAHFDEERTGDLAGRLGVEETGTGDLPAEEMGNGLLVNRLARLGVLADLVDVVAEDAGADASISGAKRLAIVEFAAVVASVADVEERANGLGGGAGDGGGDRVNPAEVSVDSGSEL